MIRIKQQYKGALTGYRFIDLFCGIGGFHLALKPFGAECVFACDSNKDARRIYATNFKVEPKGDITQIRSRSIPSHDILCGGFPCQPFSISGPQGGFSNKKSGKLFYEIIRIAKAHKPRVIFLENVANLNNHNNGKTIAKIMQELEIVGYTPYKSILNSSDFNIPQIRKRLYIVAFRSDLGIKDFTFPNPIKKMRKLEDLIEKDISQTHQYMIDRNFHLRDNYEEIEEKTKNPYIRIGEIGQGRQGERIYSVKGCATTLSSTGGGLGGRTGIYLIDKRIRKLTPRECARLMGFPDKFVIAPTANQAYQQFGNSVVIDVLQYIMINVLNKLRKE